MNTIWNQFQQGISTAQTAWMYENTGFGMAAANAYQQAVQILSGVLPSLNGPSRADALFHLGGSELQLGKMCWQMSNAMSCRSWLEAALPHLKEACRRSPANMWYQQARDQARMMLDQIKGWDPPQAPDWDPPSFDWSAAMNDLFGNGMSGMGDPVWW